MSKEIPFEKSFASHEKSKYWSNKNELKPDEVLKGSKKKYWFECEYKHLFECSRLSNITYLNQFCPECYKTNKNIKFNYTYNSLIKFCQDNNIILLQNYKIKEINRESIINGNCLNHDICKNIFNKTFRMIILNGAYCDTCTSNNKSIKISIILRENNKLIPFDKSFASNEKSKYFSIKNLDKNGNLINIKHIPLGTHDKFIFDCNICNHEFNISIDKLSIGRWCPYCCIPQKKLCGKKECMNCFEKSFASNIEKVKYYSNKNIEKPEFILKKGDKKIIFDCDICNHSFETRIKSITDGVWCPYCAIPSKILCENNDCKSCFEKSFASHEKSKFYSDNNEFNQRQLFKSSVNKCFFHCDKNHSFCSSLNNISNGKWCPYCVNKTEQKLYEQLSPYYNNLKQQYKVEWCKNKTYLPFDFVLEEFKIIIELDGLQHFEQVSNWQSPEKTQKNDKYKIKCANSNNFSVIRILQEDVYYNTYEWLTELKTNIDKIKNENIIQNIYMCKNNEYFVFQTEQLEI